MTEKTPQDRKTTDGSHKFTVKGKTYTLPAITEKTAQLVPGGATFDAIVDPDDTTAQLRLAFATLTAVKPSEAAMTALRSLPTMEMLEVVGAWMGGSSGSSE